MVNISLKSYEQQSTALTVWLVEKLSGRYVWVSISGLAFFFFFCSLSRKLNFATYFMCFQVWDHSVSFLPIEDWTSVYRFFWFYFLFDYSVAPYEISSPLVLPTLEFYLEKANALSNCFDALKCLIKGICYLIKLTTSENSWSSTFKVWI